MKKLIFYFFLGHFFLGEVTPSIAKPTAFKNVIHNSNTIYVAPPTGERNSILAALDLVQPDGTIQFATETYLVIKRISVKVPDLTVFGHSDGPIIKGCDPVEMEDRNFASLNCNGIELAASNQCVALDDPADAVRDFGQGDRVGGPGGLASPSAPPLNESEFLEAKGIRTLESNRLIFHQLFHPVGGDIYPQPRRLRIPPARGKRILKLLLWK